MDGMEVRRWAGDKNLILGDDPFGQRLRFVDFNLVAPLHVYLIILSNGHKSRRELWIYSFKVVGPP